MNKICQFILILGLMYMSCNSQGPNRSINGENLLESHEINTPITANQINYEQEFYVPIYSNVYVGQ